jgi:phosphohistidine phosphatase
MSEQSRTLVLLRHAKSDWPDGVDDHERPLAERGRRDAPEAGRWLREHVGAPDLVLVSDAVRTRSTWALASGVGGFASVPVRTLAAIYEARTATLLDLVRVAPDEVRTLVLVGHNPGTEHLAETLAGSGDAAAMASMSIKFPTSGIAVIDVVGLWSTVRPGVGVLRAFAVPRG